MDILALFEQSEHPEKKTEQSPRNNDEDGKRQGKAAIEYTQEIFLLPAASCFQDFSKNGTVILSYPLKIKEKHR